MSPAKGTAQQLSRLGAGGDHDRLRFALVFKVMLRCLPLLREVRGHLFAIVLGTLTLALLLVYPVVQLYDMFWTRVLQGQAPTVHQCATLAWFDIACDPWTDSARRAGLRALVAATGVVGVVVGVLAVLVLYYRIWILQQINQALRMRLLDRLQTLSLRFHSDSSVGDAIYRMVQDSSVVTELIDVLFLTPLRHSLVFAFSLAMIALYEPTLALALGIGWPFALYIGYRFSRPLRVGFRQAREQNSALTSLIQASLQGIRVIKAYGAEKAEQARFEAQSLLALEHAYSARSRAALYGVLVFWTFGTLVVLVIACGAWLTTHGAPLFAKRALLATGFVAWNLGLWNVFKQRAGGAMTSSEGLFGLWARMQNIAIGLDRVFETLDLDPEVTDAKDAVPLPSLSQGIEFREVGFAYDVDRPTLAGVSLVARPSTVTAIVGPTGAGKSTLMSLLLRLYDPNTGSICIDGIDLRAIQLDSLRTGMAIALQENILFGTTIRENIRYAVPDASDGAVREAARVALADEFIERLPEGYDTLLGERGAKLSTGQRQRLSIARAILKDAPILILDEPTAALDAQTEGKMLSHLTAWAKGRVVFLITHRLSTIRRADQIAFLEGGRVVEHGSHAELMARSGGAYRRFVESEAKAAQALASEGAR